jgi:adhesin transport system outer membrane protein
MRVLILAATCCVIAAPATAQQGFTITDAIKQAVQTNPGVTEAAANRRATESELRQNQSTLLPQVRLRADYGPEKLTRYDIQPPPAGDGQWRKDSREASIVVRQLLFDGLSSINEIWRQTARVDAAAARVHERTELIALDAAEAYVDVVRYTRLIALAEENVAAHRRLSGEVDQRYRGGRSGEGDLQQAQERLSGAEAVLAEFRIRLDDARAKYRRAVGLEPYNLRFPGRLPGLPGSKDDSLAVALRHNPTLRAAGADAEAAKFGFRATAGAFMPTITLEGSATKGVDSADILGKREDLSGKVVASWDIFRGGQDMWRRQELADRMIEQTQRLARLQRDAFESLDKAWAARTLTADRLTYLTRQSEAARRVIGAYTKEYELGQRTLIDLLDSQNSYFNSLVSIVSTRAVAVFADYQLLAAMGHLLEYIKTAPPPEADPLAQRPFGLLHYKLPPVILRDPDLAPEPLNVNGAVAPTPYLWGPKVVMFGERAPGWAVAETPAAKVTDMSASRAAPATESTVESRWPQAVSSFSARDAERMAGPFVTLPVGN